MAQKRPKLVQNMHFGPNIGIICPFFPMPDQKPMPTRCLGCFFVMWVTKLLISPVKIRTFCPKPSKFGPKFAFLSIAGSFGALFWVGWWLWRGCISQDTYLRYNINDDNYLNIYILRHLHHIHRHLTSGLLMSPLGSHPWDISGNSTICSKD